MKKVVTEAFDVARYRGGTGHWSYILHRLTGVGVLLFLVIHIVDTALIGWGPDVYNRAIHLYRTPFFRINEIFLFGAVLYHTINGVRIMIIDFWPGATRHHKRIFSASMTLFVLLMIPVTLIMIHHMMNGFEK